MYSKLSIFFGFALVAVISGRVVRDAPAPAPASEEVSILNIFNIATGHLKDLQDNLSKTFGIENTEQFQEKAIEQGKNVASRIDTWAIGVKQQISGLKDTGAVKELESAVDKVIDEFKEKHPESSTDIKNFVEKLNQGAEGVVTKIKELNESESAKHIKDLSKSLLDTAVDTFKKIGQEVQENLKQ